MGGVEIRTCHVGGDDVQAAWCEEGLLPREVVILAPEIIDVEETHPSHVKGDGSIPTRLKGPLIHSIPLPFILPELDAVLMD